VPNLPGCNEIDEAVGIHVWCSGGPLGAQAVPRGQPGLPEDPAEQETPRRGRGVGLQRLGRAGRVPYVSVEHEPGVWLDAHVERQWKHEGRWRLSVYYFVGSQQFYRVVDAEQVRPVTSDERRDDPERDETAPIEAPEGEHRTTEPIDLRQRAPRSATGPPD